MLKGRHQYFVYILSEKMYGTLYIGVTNNLERRMFEHKNKLVEGFTKRYNLSKLLYFEQFQYVNDAIKREKQLKNWKRDWKIELIEKDNKNWHDLSIDWDIQKV
jgi:putative endonuclease